MPALIPPRFVLAVHRGKAHFATRPRLTKPIPCSEAGIYRTGHPRRPTHSLLCGTPVSFRLWVWFEAIVVRRTVQAHEDEEDKGANERDGHHPVPPAGSFSILEAANVNGHRRRRQWKSQVHGHQGWRRRVSGHYGDWRGIVSMVMIVEFVSTNIQSSVRRARLEKVNSSSST